MFHGNAASGAYWQINFAHYGRRPGDGQALWVYEDDQATALFYRYRRPQSGAERIGIAGAGDPATCARYVLDGLAALGGPEELGTPSHIMLPDTTQNHLPGPDEFPIPGVWGGRWEHFYSVTPPSPAAGEDRVRDLSDEKYREGIRSLLQVANPTTSALEEMEDLTWYGITEGERPLSVVGAAFGNAPCGQFVHYKGLGTAPEARGQGLAAAVMSAAIRRNLEQVPVIEFGMWSFNDTARRVYQRLRIQHGQALVVSRSADEPE